MRKYISSIVEDLGEILEAGNGKDALELYIKNKPDLVIIDVNMPIMNGLEALSKMREINPNLKAIIITAYPLHKKKTDVECFITKPFNEEELLSLVREMIKYDDYFTK
ncbi:MAG: response regulator [Candidatus Methanomethylicaceae archaeon]